MQSFCFLERNEAIANRDKTLFDIIIIGGGITGAGIALDATLNGQSVLLLEKNDFSSGTTGKSTKLIHGGLRYLKQLEFKMVHDVGRERKVVYDNARHIVRPEKMLLPIYKKGSLGFFSSSIALWFYDILGGIKKSERRKMFNSAETMLTEPMLLKDGLEGSGVYYEYRTDDARLCIEVIKTAARIGAKCFNYMEVKDFVYGPEEKVIGVNAIDKTSNQVYEFYGKTVINAAGPWVDGLRQKNKSLSDKKLMLTKGVHLVFPFDKIPIAQSVYFDTLDNRMIFAIPRQSTTYVGTTDTKHISEKEQPKVTKEDVDYLIKNIKNTLNVSLVSSDILSSWAGLRPLIHEEGKSPSEVSRKDEIFVSNSGLLSIAGGKLTGYRLMAEEILDVVLQKNGTRKKERKSTKQTKLVGGNFIDEENLQSFILTQIKVGETIGIEPAQIKNWVYRYGTETSKIIENVKKQSSQEAESTDRSIIAELHFVLKNECIYTLSDFLIRRTGMLYFESEKITNELCEKLNDEIGRRLKKTTEQNQQSIEAFKKEWRDSKSFE